MQAIFTPLPEMDIEILHNMDDKTLIEMCLINKYVNNLCKKDKYIYDRITNFKLLQDAFIYQPNINPVTGNKIKIGGSTYRKLVTKYGAPKKLLNPETGRPILKNSRTYNLLIYKGYTEKQLRSNILM
jgi:hypothetical protein